MASEQIVKFSFLEFLEKPRGSAGSSKQEMVPSMGCDQKHRAEGKWAGVGIENTVRIFHFAIRNTFLMRLFLKTKWFKIKIIVNL